MAKRLEDGPKTSLDDIIHSRQHELEKLNDKISDYDDPQWILDRKAKLVERREAVEQELAILVGAHSRLKRS
jgi:hypothetical protein